MPKMPFMVRCNCYGEAIAVEAHDGEDEVYISFWEQGRHPTHLSTRIRHIRNIIKNGHPYTDMVVLSLEETEALGKHLIERAAQMRSATKQKEAANNGDCSTDQVHDSVSG